jgi:lipoprotein NlpD
VSKGETLYSIAWRYHLDFRRLALANNIGSGYQIVPGQKLLLKEGIVVSAGKTRTEPSVTQAVTPVVKKVTPVAKVAIVEIPTVNEEKPKILPPKKPAESASKPVQIAKNEAWIWPRKGRVL